MTLKQKKQNLTQRFSIRLPPEVHKQWNKLAQAEEMSLANWARLRIQNSIGEYMVKDTYRRTPRKPEVIGNYSQVDPELVRQVAMIGNNLNQLTRLANTKSHLPHLLELKKISNQVKSLLYAHQTS